MEVVQSLPQLSSSTSSSSRQNPESSSSSSHPPPPSSSLRSENPSSLRSEHPPSSLRSSATHPPSSDIPPPSSPKKSGFAYISSADVIFVLSYSIIMLNTDLHNNQIKNKMKLEDFIRNNKGINDGDNLPDEFLEDIYKSIKHHEIKLHKSNEIIESNRYEEYFWLDHVLERQKYIGRYNININDELLIIKMNIFNILIGLDLIKCINDSFINSKTIDEMKYYIRIFWLLIRICLKLEDYKLINIIYQLDSIDVTYTLSYRCQLSIPFILNVIATTSNYFDYNSWMKSIDIILRLYCLNLLPLSFASFDLDPRIYNGSCRDLIDNIIAPSIRFKRNTDLKKNSGWLIGLGNLIPFNRITMMSMTTSASATTTMNTTTSFNTSTTSTSSSSSSSSYNDNEDNGDDNKEAFLFLFNIQSGSDLILENNYFDASLLKNKFSPICTNEDEEAINEVTKALCNEIDREELLPQVLSYMNLRLAFLNVYKLDLLFIGSISSSYKDSFLYFIKVIINRIMNPYNVDDSKLKTSIQDDNLNNQSYLKSKDYFNTNFGSLLDPYINGLDLFKNKINSIFNLGIFIKLSMNILKDTKKFLYIDNSNNLYMIKRRIILIYLIKCLHIISNVFIINEAKNYLPTLYNILNTFGLLIYDNEFNFIENNNKYGTSLNLHEAALKFNKNNNTVASHISITLLKLILWIAENSEIDLNSTKNESYTNINHIHTPPEVTSTEGYTTSLGPADSSPLEVQTSVPLAVEASSNYLSLKGDTTPGDRGEISEMIYGSRGEVNREATTASGMKSGTGPQVEPVADLREAEGEVNKKATTAVGRHDGVNNSTGPQVEPAAVLREAEGEVNKKATTASGNDGHRVDAVCKMTSGGRDDIMDWNELSLNFSAWLLHLLINFEMDIILMHLDPISKCLYNLASLQCINRSTYMVSVILCGLQRILNPNIPRDVIITSSLSSNCSYGSIITLLIRRSQCLDAKNSNIARLASQVLLSITLFSKPSNINSDSKKDWNENRMALQLLIEFKTFSSDNDEYLWLLSLHCLSIIFSTGPKCLSNEAMKGMYRLLLQDTYPVNKFSKIIQIVRLFDYILAPMLTFNFHYPLSKEKLTTPLTHLKYNKNESYTNINHIHTPPEVTSTEGYTTSLGPADSSPLEVQTSVPLAVEASSNYLSLKGDTTPGDRGEISEMIYGSRGEVNREATTASGMKSGTGPQVEPVADLREAEGELNREAVCKTTSSGEADGRTSTSDGDVIMNGKSLEMGSKYENDWFIQNPFIPMDKDGCLNPPEITWMSSVIVNYLSSYNNIDPDDIASRKASATNLICQTILSKLNILISEELDIIPQNVVRLGGTNLECILYLSEEEKCSKSCIKRFLTIIQYILNVIIPSDGEIYVELSRDTYLESLRNFILVLMTTPELKTAPDTCTNHFSNDVELKDCLELVKESVDLSNASPGEYALSSLLAHTFSISDSLKDLFLDTLKVVFPNTNDTLQQ